MGDYFKYSLKWAVTTKVVLTQSSCAGVRSGLDVISFYDSEIFPGF